MAEEKSGKEIAGILNSCFWSDDLVDARRNCMGGEGAFTREQSRQEIVDHLSSDAILAITIALARKSLDKIREAHTRITRLREAAQNTIATIDRAREDADGGPE